MSRRLGSSPKIECVLKRNLPSGTRVPCFEENLSGGSRAIVAVVDDRHLDLAPTPEHPKWSPYEGGYMIPLDGEPRYDCPDPYDNGPWHFIDVHVNRGQVQVHEVTWPENRHDCEADEILTVDLDWEFGDDDGVETIRIPYGKVTYVVPLRYVPDSREVPPSDTSIPPRRRHTPEERRRNGLTV